MAIITGPFFSTWASGSIGKSITVRACFNDCKFVMTGKQRTAGKRHEIQIHNSEVFKSRGQDTKKAMPAIRALMEEE